MEDNIFITGANSELGKGVINKLASHDKKSWVIAFDTEDLDEKIKPNVDDYIKGEVNDTKIVQKVITDNKISSIFHLSSVLLTESEENPEQAVKNNINDTKTLLELTYNIAQETKKNIKFVFPSSIAVFGISTLQEKNTIGKIKENQYNQPLTIYGVSKLIIELLGTYYSRNYKILSGVQESFLDFRALRLPGIISAINKSTKTDQNFAYNMLHSAAKGEGHESYVRPNSVLPFITLPDAVHAVLQIAEAPRKRLKSSVYNVSAFSASAQQIAEVINMVFPDSAISFNPDVNKQRIVDSWPKDFDNSAARTDWNWQPEYDLKKAFYEYLIPEIQNKQV